MIPLFLCVYPKVIKENVAAINTGSKEDKGFLFQRAAMPGKEADLSHTLRECMVLHHKGA